MSFFSARCRFTCFLLALFLGAGLSAATAIAQSDSVALPDDPSSLLVSQNASPPSAATAQPQALPSQNDAQTGSIEGKQTKRILGIVPNFRSVSANAKLPPETPKEKFREATQDAFDYSDFVYVAMLAGVGQAENSYPEFHQGTAGYARYYWHSLVDQVDEDYQTEFIWPALTHEDPRYYTLGHGGFFRRTAYSFSRFAITRTDSGHETFNISEIGGAGTAAGIANLYYPQVERTWTKTGQHWVLDIGLDGATYIFQEFWPDINNKFFHQKN
ncbi:MAG TPA: hypothetical protein VHZ25_01810 [Acidobacteriaceae bacterium]|nr:hypothetical protein [Acidobacteriaceae bacterium]